MPFSEIFSDFFSSLSFQEVHAEAPQADDDSEDKGEEAGEGEEKSEGGEDEEKEEGGDDKDGEDGGNDEGGDDDEEVEEEEEEPEDIKPKLEEGTSIWPWPSLRSIFSMAFVSYKRSCCEVT